MNDECRTQILIIYRWLFANAFMRQPLLKTTVLFATLLC